MNSTPRSLPVTGVPYLQVLPPAVRLRFA